MGVFMSEMIPVSSSEQLDTVVERLESGQDEPVRRLLDEAHPAETASLLESLPPQARSQLWELVPVEQEAEVLPHLHDEVRSKIIQEMEREEVVAAFENMDVEDMADAIEDLPGRFGDAVFASLDADQRQRLEAALSFDEDSAGRLMSRNVVSVRKDVTLSVVARYLRWHSSLPTQSDAVMVISEDGIYQGKLPIVEIVTGDPEALVTDVMLPGADCVLASASTHDIALMFERRDLISVAVIDESDRLLGRITVDDVLDIIRTEADAAFLKRAGLDEEADLFAPTFLSVRRRSVWLGINLLTVFLAVAVIGQFEDALDKLVVLAILMPIVASMGGIAGSQTLTLTIRGLALGQIASANVRWLANKELAIGAMNGFIWAAIVGLATALWFGDLNLGAIIAAAMLINLVVAAISGVLLPFALQRLGVDPALSGAVILTTVTDVVGFTSFLGLATLLLI